MGPYLILHGIIVHIILLLSIFDIYFKSPIVNNVPPIISENIAPADRLVLVVADGLRAETLVKSKLTAFEDMSNVAPYLSGVCRTKGSWGISHTRMPTESRPGHVALAAGFYEDPSAVAKGWKENTVEFDSIFNESAYTWAWGSPDIVPMFARGSSKNHVYYDCYNSEQQDFSGKKSTALLDTWVFEKVHAFFKNATNDKDLFNKLMMKKIVFFLHLLGLDTAGHAHKPHAPEYFTNLKIVDEGVKHIERAIEDFYRDNKTAYVFTADHGMTDWGSHGAGSIHETETPFIVWGAGIRQNPHPVDISQADIAPFMATLLSVPIPVNSVGVLPVEYLNLPENEIAQAVFSNARQIVAQINEKRKRTKESTWTIFYKPFSKLESEELEQYYDSAHLAQRNKNYKIAIKIYKDIINIALEGLDYYQNYYQNILLLATTMSYTGWMVLLLINILQKPHKHHKTTFQLKKSLKINILFLNFAVIIIFILISQHMPVLFYFHFLLPIYLWWLVVSTKKTSSLSFLKNTVHKSKLTTAFSYVLYLIGVEILVLSFFERSALIVTLIYMSVWPYFTGTQRISNLLKVLWTVNCLILSIFPLLPTVGSENNTVLVLSYGCIWLLFGVFFLLLPKYFSKFHMGSDKRHNVTTLVSNIFMFVSLVNIFIVDQSFRAKSGLPSLNQYISWLMFVASLVLPLCGSVYVTNRLLNVALALSIPIMLLSVNYEPIFISQYFAQLYLWLNIEFNLERDTIDMIKYLRFTKMNYITNNSKVQTNDFRRAYFFLFYIILGFFGTGNMASINSFDPQWVRNFLTVFNPFVMGALILIKIVIPFLLASCALRAVTVAVNTSIRKIFLIILLFGDLMGVQFLYFVTNKGSWLDIGTSISRFVIVQSIVVFLILFYYLAILLTEKNLNFDSITNIFKKRV